MKPFEFDPALHGARRARLAQAMQGGVAIIPTAPERIRNRDTHYPYRFDSHFYYLTGFPEPEAVLVIVGGAQPKSLLFCREKNEEREIWDGFRYGAEAARTVFGFDEAHSIQQMDALMPDFIVLDFDLDGETTARLKAHISTRGTPVIALAKMEEVRQRGSVS